jgi:hypothetical protein
MHSKKKKGGREDFAMRDTLLIITKRALVLSPAELSSIFSILNRACRIQRMYRANFSFTVGREDSARYRLFIPLESRNGTVS